VKFKLIRIFCLVFVFVGGDLFFLNFGIFLAGLLFLGVGWCFLCGGGFCVYFDWSLI